MNEHEIPLIVATRQPSGRPAFFPALHLIPPSPFTLKRNGCLRICPSLPLFCFYFSVVLTEVTRFVKGVKQKMRGICKAKWYELSPDRTKHHSKNYTHGSTVDYSFTRT